MGFESTGVYIAFKGVWDLKMNGKYEPIQFRCEEKSNCSTFDREM